MVSQKPTVLWSPLFQHCLPAWGTPNSLWARNLPGFSWDNSENTTSRFGIEELALSPLAADPRAHPVVLKLGCLLKSPGVL